MQTEQHRTKAALSCLDDSLEATGLGRKGQAELVDESETAFRKMVSGSQAFGIESIERLPDAVLFDFLQRWGKTRGFRILPIDVDAEVFTCVQNVYRIVGELVAMQQLRGIQMKPAKASLPEPVQERRRA